MKFRAESLRIRERFAGDDEAMFMYSLMACKQARWEIISAAFKANNVSAKVFYSIFCNNHFSDESGARYTYGIRSLAYAVAEHYGGNYMDYYYDTCDVDPEVEKRVLDSVGLCKIKITQ
jgi:hypothetical protein